MKALHRIIAAFLHLLEVKREEAALRRMWFSAGKFSRVRGMPLLDAVFIQSADEPQRGGQGIIFAGVLQTKTKIIYHIPFAGEDKMMIRKIVEQMRAQAGRKMRCFITHGGRTDLPDLGKNRILRFVIKNLTKTSFFFRHHFVYKNSLNFK